MITNAITNTKIPRNVNTSALITFPSGIRFISFSSSVVMVAAVNRTVGPRIISHRLRNIFQLIHGIQAPAAVFRDTDGSQNEHSVDQINSTQHNSLSVRTTVLNNGRLRMIALRPTPAPAAPAMQGHRIPSPARRVAHPRDK